MLSDTPGERYLERIGDVNENRRSYHGCRIIQPYEAV